MARVTTRREHPYKNFAVLLSSTLLVLLFTLFGTASAQTTAYSEAPQLAERVAAGELPPVEERLPSEPMVVEPLEQTGTYGGTLRSVLRGPDDTFWLEKTIGYEPLVRWGLDGKTVVPNVAESFEVNDDATEFRFTLREGMKWSDGEPFTTDDIRFWYEDVFINDELSPTRTDWLMSGGEPVQLEVVDDTTFILRFAEPNGFLLQHIAGSTNEGDLFTNYPRHYAEQFHPNYNENVAELTRQEGFDTWTQLFESKMDDWRSAVKPSLLAWRVTNPYGEGTRAVAERNPYYWKVDTAGNQLPYIDRVTFDVAEDNEVILLKALNGELDLEARYINDNTNKPVLFDNQERGGYRFYGLEPTHMNEASIALNLTHPDPVKREIFNNKDFRIGLSYAINRPEIIDLVFIGQGEPWQNAPNRSTPYFNEELAKQYTEYNPQLANEYLDKAFPEKNAQGLRLGPDGQPITFTVLARTDKQLFIDTMELVRQNLREVGIDMQVSPVDRSLFFERLEANQHDAIVLSGNWGDIDALLEPAWYTPINTRHSAYAVPWAQWYNNHQQGEEPPQAVKDQLALYDQLQATADPAKQTELMKSILDIAQDQFYALGIVLPPTNYGIISRDIRNAPESMIGGSIVTPPGYTMPEQYFFANSSQ